MKRKEQGGCALPSFQLHQDAIPSVSADNVWHAGIATVEYADREGLSTDDVVELLAMLRINADTLENGLHASGANGEQAASSAVSSGQVHATEAVGGAA